MSHDTGITLPDDCGIYLGQCDIEEIEEAVRRAHSLARSELAMQIRTCQSLAEQNYSRERFSTTVGSVLEELLARQLGAYHEQAS